MLQTIYRVNKNGTNTCIRRMTFFLFWCAADHDYVRDAEDLNIIVLVLH